MNITHHTETNKLTADFIEHVRRVFKGKHIRITVEEVTEYAAESAGEVPQAGEAAEPYLTTDASEHTDAMQEQMVEQAMRAEKEILEGKGLTASEARAIMQAAFKG